MDSSMRVMMVRFTFPPVHAGLAVMLKALDRCPIGGHLSVVRSKIATNGATYDVPWLRHARGISECPTHHGTTNRSSRSVTCVS